MRLTVARRWTSEARELASPRDPLAWNPYYVLQADPHQTFTIIYFYTVAMPQVL